MKKSIQIVIIFAIGILFLSNCCSTKVVTGEKTNVGGHEVVVMKNPDGTEEIYIDGVLQQQGGTNTACTTTSGVNCTTTNNSSGNNCNPAPQPKTPWWNEVKVEDFCNPEQAGFSAYAKIDEGAEYSKKGAYFILESASNFTRIAQESSVAPEQTGTILDKPVYSYEFLYQEYGMVSH